MKYEGEYSIAPAIQVSVILKDRYVGKWWDERLGGRNTICLFYQENYNTNIYRTDIYRTDFTQK